MKVMKYVSNLIDSCWSSIHLLLGYEESNLLDSCCSKYWHIKEPTMGIGQEGEVGERYYCPIGN